MRWAALLFSPLLFACTHQPLGVEEKQNIHVISAASFLGDDFVVDVIDRTIFQKKESIHDVESWQVDQQLRDLLAEEARKRGKEFRSLELDPAEVNELLERRESRWKRVVGKQSQALMELLFRQAEKQGVEYLLLAAPAARRDNFPLHIGQMGVFCYDRKLRKSQASPYFFFDFSLWNVASRKKLFQTTVDPTFTRDRAFAECAKVAEIKDVKEELAAPAREALAAVVQRLFLAMGF